MFRSNVLVCGGTGCTSSNSEKIIEKLKEEISAKGLDQEVNVVRTGCFGLCALGPIMIVYPEGAFYSRVTPEDVPEIVEEHLLKGRIVRRLLYKETVVDESTTKSLNETTFYAKQMRVALRNCGVINPEQIDEYIALDGYQQSARFSQRRSRPSRSFRPCSIPASAVVAVQASPPVLSGNSQRQTMPIRNMYVVTPTRATRAHSWTVPFWKATRTASSKP